MKVWLYKLYEDMMRTEGSLRRKIWKPFDWILLWLEKYWQTLIRRWRKESDRRRKKVTIEDVIKKSILPLAFMVFWFWMTKTIMKVSGQTDWFWWIFIAGLPFGIHKMRLILIPRGMDTTATLGMATLSVIIGALIGCIMIPVYVIRAVYVFLRYIIGK